MNTPTILGITMKSMMMAALENITDNTPISEINKLPIYAIEKIDTKEIETIDNMVDSLDNLDNALELLENKDAVSNSEVYLAQVALESIGLTVGVTSNVGIALESIGDNKGKIAHMRKMVEQRTLRALRAATESVSDNSLHYEFSTLERAVDNFKLKDDATLIIEHHGVHDFLTINNKHINSFKDLGKDDLAFVKDTLSESKSILKDLEKLAARRDGDYKSIFAELSSITGRKSIDKLTRYKLMNNGYSRSTRDGLDVDYMSVANDGSAASYLKRFGYSLGVTIPGTALGIVVGMSAGAAVGTMVALPLVGLGLVLGTVAADYSERGKNTSTIVTPEELKTFLKLCVDIGAIADDLVTVHDAISSTVASIVETLHMHLKSSTEDTVGDRVLDITTALLKANERTAAAGTAGRSKLDRGIEELNLFAMNKQNVLTSISGAGIYHAWLFAISATGIVETFNK